MPFCDIRNRAALAALLAAYQLPRPLCAARRAGERNYRADATAGFCGHLVTFRLMTPTGRRASLRGRRRGETNEEEENENHQRGAMAGACALDVSAVLVTRSIKSTVSRNTGANGRSGAANAPIRRR
jgi:hypothetical protein